MKKVIMLAAFAIAAVSAMAQIQYVVSGTYDGNGKTEITYKCPRIRLNIGNFRNFAVGIMFLNMNKTKLTLIT